MNVWLDIECTYALVSYKNMLKMLNEKSFHILVIFHIAIGPLMMDVKSYNALSLFTMNLFNSVVVSIKSISLP